jgi:hypothetical protein
MSTNKETSGTKFTNPSDLPPRYEIRRLTEADLPATNAILFHSHLFYSPVWPFVYPENKTGRIYRCAIASEYFVRHQLKSGMSFGIFDAEYVYKNPESAASGGKLYWDAADESADRDKLLAQMDFPLVSVALAYDGIEPFEREKIAPLIEELPLFANINRELGIRDQRKAEDWKPTAARQVLMRNATSTRHDYEGRGLMKILAHFLMREAKGKGCRGIQIDTVSDAVYHVWGNVPAPFRNETVCSVDSWTMADEVDGVKMYPCKGLTQVLHKVYVHL